MRESAHSKKTRIETAPVNNTRRIKRVKAPIPRKQGLKLRPRKKHAQRIKRWKRPFQENKDWNHTINKKLIEYHQVKAPIPRKQGLKPFNFFKF